MKLLLKNNRSKLIIVLGLIFIFIGIDPKKVINYSIDFSQVSYEQLITYSLTSYVNRNLGT